VAAHRRHHGPGDERTVKAARELREAAAAEHVKRIVDAAPPLSAEAKAKLAVLLLSGGEAA
jgi:hypothetical protein